MVTRFKDKLIQAHLDVLWKDVFQIDTKWPQFALLINDLVNLSLNTPTNSTVVCFERTLLYGGFSLVAPLFPHVNFISIDASPESANERGGYNSNKVSHKGFIRIPFTYRASIENTGLQSEIADLVLVPNLVHHVADQSALFSELNRVLKKKATVYIFESILRELHQMPDDYIRYTPFGLEKMLTKYGFSDFVTDTKGGPFEAITYCWIQALEYFPKERRSEMESWFYDKHFNELLSFDKKYRKNLVRKHTAFPVGFSVRANKSATLKILNVN